MLESTNQEMERQQIQNAQIVALDRFRSQGPPFALFVMQGNILKFLALVLLRPVLIVLKGRIKVVRE